MKEHLTTPLADPELAERERRVFGPPGTGKTTWLAGSIKKTVQTRHTGRVLVASFTRTAAQEIAGRGLPLQSAQVGTLHALAYRSIGFPEVAQEHLPDWNRLHPEAAMTVGYREGVEEMAPAEISGSTEGDELMSRLDEQRARMVPRNLWPIQVQAFERKWSAWKAREGLVDFTDMISLAQEMTEEAPGQPLVGFFDEVQDFTPLELNLVRHWGKKMERVVLAGDDDQCIYTFKGATPEAFLDPPLPDDCKWVLEQSYRVPAAVHAVAESWIKRVAKREPKVYRPREEQGRVRRGDFRYTDPGPVVRDVLRKVDEGKTVMLLSTCAYMLDRVKHELRAEGVPFHNPYRKSRIDWNPMRASRGSSGADKLLAYLILDERIFGDMSREWTGADVKRWTSVIKKQGVFRRGAAAALQALPDRLLTYEEVAALFDDESQLARAVEPSLAWFKANLLASAKSSLEYPIRVAEKRGPRALVEAPRVCIGTIHSVKGGQADVVYLFPDLSMAGMREWTDGRRRDSIRRQMYVGMTRAKEELVVCTNSTQWAVDPDRLVRGG